MLHRLPVQIALAVIFIAVFNSLQGVSSVAPEAKVPVSGNYLLIVRDPEAVPAPPQSQLDIPNSADVRDWVNANCAKGQDGNAKFRVATKASTFADDDPTWDQLMAVSRPSDNSVLLDHDGRVYTQAMPSDPKSLVTWLNKYGGK